MKTSKKVRRKKTPSDRLSKKLVYIFLLLLALPITILFLVQNQSLSQHAQTVPSPACLGPCAASGSPAPSLGASPGASTAPCVPSQSRDRDGGNIIQVLLQFFMKLIEALLGGSFGNTTPSNPAPVPVAAPTPSPVPADGTEGTSPAPPCPPASSSSSSSSSSSTSSTAPAAGACVAPPGMTALLDQDTSDSQLPWKRNGAEKVNINFETKGVNAEFKGHMEYAVKVWNKSPCLDLKLVDTCQPNTNCVTATAPDANCGSDGNFDAQESGGFTTGGHFCVNAGLGAGENKNVTIHEMGHAIGLVHRKTPNVLMNADTYPDVFDPDEIEYKNLLFDYGRQQ